MKVYGYCDASYSPKHKLAVVGFSSSLNNERDIIYKNETDTNNVRAEVIAIFEILKYLKINMSISTLRITVYSDCKSVVTRMENIKTLNDINYKNRKGQYIKNYDLYGQIHDILESMIIPVKIKHIKGHVKKHNMKKHNVNFSYVDRGCRKNLRRIINSVMSI